MPYISYFVLTAVLMDSPPAPATPPVPPVDPETVESDADRFVKKSAESIDGIEYLDTRFRQVVRSSGHVNVAHGTYRRGSGYLSRFELDVPISEKETAKRIQACDGTTTFVYQNVLGNESLETFAVSQVMPLIESREMTPELRKQIYLNLPFVEPGEMLRGYMKGVRFTSMSETTLGMENPRPVTLVEGVWRRTIVALLAQDTSVSDAKKLPGSIPQYMRLYLDKATSFPLRVELYRVDDEAEYKPIYVLEFTEVRTEKLKPEDFTFVPPAKVPPVDVTSRLVAQLSQLPEKPKTAGAPAPNPGQSIAQPLEPTK